METNDDGSAGASPLAPELVPSFDSTPWSVVLRARDHNDPDAQSALAALCQTYWYPLYAYIRRRCGSAEEAEDATQEFFVRFLEKGFGSEVQREKGKFRAFLLACCQHFMANQRKHDRAQKRGGCQAKLSLDVESASQNYLREPADTLDAQKLFDRRWALTLLERSLDQLGREFQEHGKESLYAELKCYLTGDEAGRSYADVAERLGMTESAVKKAAQRLRQRCGAIVRAQIRATVNSPEQVEDEVRELFTVLAG